MPVVDIECPRCGATEEVRKTDLYRYRCAACGHEFEADDVTA